MVSSVNFKANFVNKAIVQKLSTKDKYGYCEASFVELNPCSQNDRISLKVASQNWKQDSTYARNICENMCNVKFDDIDNSVSQFYALTSQKKDFDILKPENILGILELEEKSSYVYIKMIQTHPDYIYNSNSLKNRFSVLPKYKNVGKAMIKSLRDKFVLKRIMLKSIFGKENFYLKCGFKRQGENFILKAKRF